MYKLIFIDLDGTLLDSKQQISQYNCEVIKSLEAQAKIVLSSARGFYRMKKYVEQLDLLNSNNYTISYNGSLTIDNLENKIINESLEKNHLFELIKFIKMNDPHKWYFHCYDKKINLMEVVLRKINKVEIDGNETFLNQNILYESSLFDNFANTNTYKEFTSYEYERTKDGEIMSGYPDADNHHIDAVRYATEQVWKRRGQ